MDTSSSFVIDRVGKPAAWNTPSELQKDVSETVASEQVENENSDADEDLSGAEDVDVSKKKTKRRVAAWEDEEDGNNTVNLVKRRRTRKFRKKMGEKQVSTAEYTGRIRDFYAEKVAVKTGGTGDWARLPSHADDKNNSGSDSENDFSDDDDDNGLSETVQRLMQKSGTVVNKRNCRSAQALVAKTKNTLKPGSISIRRMQNANYEAPNKSVTNSVEFHPSGKLLLTAGLDRTLRIFQVDGKHNAKIQGVKLNDLQISSAHFTNGGDSVVLSGAQRHVYKFDMNSGAIARVSTAFKVRKPAKGVKVLNDIRNQFVTTKDGSVLAFLSDAGRVTLMADQSMQQIGHIHVPGQLTSACFDPADKNYLYTTARAGIVHLWDLRRMECVDQHRDEGAVHASSVGVSPTHYAVGGDTGIVNVYDKAGFGENAQQGIGSVRTGKPVKTIDNLTTSVSQTVFNLDGKILAVASRTLKDSFRLVHTPSMTVFSNWPSQTAGIRRVQTLAFSPGGGYLAVGNDKGDAHLYRLNAYPAN